MTPVPNSSYSFDDQEYLVGMADFLTQRHQVSIKRKSKASTSSILNSSDGIDVDYEMLQEASNEILDGRENTALCYISGYVLRSLKNRSTICKQCLIMTESSNQSETDSQLEYQKFAWYSANVKNKNFYVPSLATFRFFKAMEVLFRSSKNCLQWNTAWNIAWNKNW